MYGRQQARQLDEEKVIVGAGELEIDGVNVGYTQEGVTFSYGRSLVDVEADQELTSIKTRKSGEELTISTSLLEATLQNLRIVWDVCGTVLTGGGTSQLKMGGRWDVTDRELWFSGPGPDGKTRYVEVFKVYSIEPGEHAYKRDGAVVIPVVFKARADRTKPRGEQLAVIIDTDDTWEPCGE